MTVLKLNSSTHKSRSATSPLLQELIFEMWNMAGLLLLGWKGFLHLANCSPFFFFSSIFYSLPPPPSSGPPCIFCWIGRSWIELCYRARFLGALYQSQPCVLNTVLRPWGEERMKKKASRELSSSSTVKRGHCSGSPAGGTGGFLFHEENRRRRPGLTLRVRHQGGFSQEDQTEGRKSSQFQPFCSFWIH